MAREPKADSRTVSPIGFRLDTLLVGGWIILVLLGQGILNVEVPALEWVASLWLWAGVLLVRRTVCIPLLLLTCPVFMCEDRRPWAWVQPVAMWFFLLRILVEAKFSRRLFLLTLGTGGLVLALSWPAHAGDLLVELSSFPPRQIVRQWLAPHAVWAIFPFRQSVDRALFAMVLTGAALSGRYLSTWRCWRAFWLSGMLALLAALSMALLPWQAPHGFLGTTNNAVYGGRLFHGAGVNITYFAFLIVLAVPWFYGPFRGVARPLSRGCIGLLAPAIVIHQRALWIALAVLAGMGIVRGGLVFVRKRGAGRLGPRRPHVRRDAVLFLSMLAVSLSLSAAWFWRMGITDPNSLLRYQLRNRLSTLFSLRIQDETVRMGWDKPGESADDLDLSPARGTGKLPRPANQLMKWVVTRDKPRGRMWSLGLKTCIERHIWRGAGAGTWARFHRSQHRPSSTYGAHMHNTYLDLAFEYGIALTLAALALCAVGFVRIVTSSGWPSGLWSFPLAALAILALGQHLFYAFTTLCALLPAALVLCRALSRPASRTLAES